MKVNSVWTDQNDRRLVIEFKGERGEVWIRYLDRQIDPMTLKAWINSLINDVEVRQ